MKMSTVTHLVARSAGSVLRRAVATLAALALIAVNVGAACECLTEAIANPARACCCSPDSESSPTMVHADACGADCLIARTIAPVGESLAVTDGTPSAGLPVPVADLRHALAVTPTPVSLAVPAQHILWSLHPILRI
jgi:hypothetical protein